MKKYLEMKIKALENLHTKSIMSGNNLFAQSICSELEKLYAKIWELPEKE